MLQEGSTTAADIMKQLKTKTQLKEAIAYLKESLAYIYITIALFTSSIAIGFIYRTKLTFLNQIINEMTSKIIGLNAAEIIFFILQNNLQSSLLAIVFGTLFGIFPIINALSNGLVIGYVLGLTYDIAGASEWWRLLPHGTFELPAIFISIAVGMKLGFSIFLAKPRRINEFRRRLYNAMNVFLMIVIPLLILAAIIEGALIKALS